MSEPKKRTRKKKEKELIVPSLSCVPVNQHALDDVRKVVFDSINNSELQKALDNFLKKGIRENNIVVRDLAILKNAITEYLNSFILLGYNLEDQRVIIQHFGNAKDRDAIMEFLKTVFIKQQQENFLDFEGEDYE